MDIAIDLQEGRSVSVYTFSFSIIGASMWELCSRPVCSRPGSLGWISVDKSALEDTSNMNRFALHAW
jgi:hypothetical protein